MRNRILPYQVNRILKGRHQKLHRQILGVDVTDRAIVPIYNGIYYVDVHDAMGRMLAAENTPAKCLYADGHIVCLYDERVPLTEARLVHEFLHRAARRRFLFRDVSGLDTHPGRTFLNESVTEYLTMRIVGESYAKQVSKRNPYLRLSEELRRLEEKRGLEAMVRAYMNGNVFYFRGLKG